MYVAILEKLTQKASIVTTLY